MKILIQTFCIRTMKARIEFAFVYIINRIADIWIDRTFILEMIISCISYVSYLTDSIMLSTNEIATYFG